MDLDELVGAISDVFGTPAVLEDRDFNLVAYNTQPNEIDAVRAGRSGDTELLEPAPDLGGRPARSGRRPSRASESCPGCACRCGGTV